MHSALWLVLAFFTAAAHWLMLGAEFLAIVLVLVYVGAVMVLFLFVIMMLDINFETLREASGATCRWASPSACWSLLEMALVLLGSYLAPAALPGAGPGAGDNTRALGRLLYTDYVYPFEIAAVILLVAIVAAIALTHRQRKETKHQDPGQQVKVRARDRLRVLSMPSEKRER